MHNFHRTGIERAASRRMERESVTNLDKILQALRLLTRGETIPAAGSDSEKAPADDDNTEPARSVPSQRGSVVSHPFCQ
jgi:hypothetical protein